MVPRAIAPEESIRSCRVGIRPLILLLHDVAALLRHFQVADDLGKAEHAHRHVGEADAVGQFGDVEGHAAGAGFQIGADHRQQQAGEDHGDGLEHRALGKHHRENQAEHHQREIFRRPEQQRDRR